MKARCYVAFAAVTFALFTAVQLQAQLSRGARQCGALAQQDALFALRQRGPRQSGGNTLDQRAQGASSGGQGHTAFISVIR